MDFIPINNPFIDQKERFDEAMKAFDIEITKQRDFKDRQDNKRFWIPVCISIIAIIIAAISLWLQLKEKKVISQVQQEKTQVYYKKVYR
jgi:hypothetical protein